ncbi:flagellar export chaperone FliS [Clostridium cylindrosporum]|uniref:Flagellar secretion chaperone FliS n=1 Tax=Clostridium cylindrosporum DSM 605 TaxID=1121307 RepID=A0A0J8D6I4_CLOCY|nr:flagellar export chaperone FliS [Clostridium cylindrosporum]KMT21695.1 flagellar protein FliS [Clostridium cylindrosporum DSM 605]
MINSNALNAYQSNSVNTASREKLLIMLLDGLVKFMRQGIVGLEEKSIKVSNSNFQKAQSIILELQSTLDLARGGEIASSLNLLYDYLYRRLIDANIKKDKEVANEVLGFCIEIRDTFSEAYKKMKK